MDFNFETRLSETKFMETLDFTKPFKVMVDAPTGGGKTFYVIDFLKKNNISFVFLVDTLFLMKQISEEYKIDSYSAQNRENYDKSQLVSVYNHIEGLYKNKVVVIDESHSMVTDYGYKRNVVEDLLVFGGEASQVILLSGTPIVSNDEFYNDFEYIKCTKLSPKTYTLNVINGEDSEDKLNTVISLAKDMKERNKIPVISLLDTRDTLNDLCDLLTINGFTNVGLINSVVKDGEMDLDSSHYNDLITTGIIDADCIVTTYVQGYNINNENCGLIIFPTRNKHSYISIVQMVARFRKIENLEAYLITTEGKEKVDENGEVKVIRPWYNFNNMFQTINESLTTDVLNYINKTKSEYTTNRAIRKFINLNHELSYLVNVDLELDNQMLALDVVNKITNLMYQHMITANTVLNKYNINIKEFTNNFNEMNMNRTDLKTLDYTIAVNTFFNNLEVGRIPQTPMNLKVLEAYKELKDTYRLLDREIKEILLSTFGNKKEYERVKLAMDFRTSEDKDIKNIRRVIFTTFKVGEWYSSETIKNTVSGIISSNGGLVSLNRANEIFNFLFETEEYKPRVNGKSVRGYKILTIK